VKSPVDMRGKTPVGMRGEKSSRHEG